MESKMNKKFTRNITIGSFLLNGFGMINFTGAGKAMGLENYPADYQQWANDNSYNLGDYYDYYQNTQKLSSLLESSPIDWDEASALLTAGADSNAQNSFGDSLLHYAASEGNQPWVEYLIGNGADINKIDQYSKTPLDYANENGYSDISTLLTDNGANTALNLAGENGKTALHHAVESGRLEEIQAIIDGLWEKYPGLSLKVGRDLSSDDSNGNTALHLAVLSGNSEIVTLLLGAGHFTSCKNIEGKTPLILAIENNNAELVNMLIVRGEGEEKIKDNNGLTPLHYAASRGNMDIVNRLIEAGTDVSETDQWGWDPVWYAVASGHQGVVIKLIDKIPWKQSSSGTTIYSQVKDRLDNYLGFLKGRGREKDVNGNTLLHIAMQYGQIEFMKILMDIAMINNYKNYGRKFSLYEQNNHGNTPLHLAAECFTEGFMEAFKEEIQREIRSKKDYQMMIKGALETENENGLAPLHYAVVRNNIEAVKAFWEVGANKNAIAGKSQDGKRWYHLEYFPHLYGDARPVSCRREKEPLYSLEMGRFYYFNDGDYGHVKHYIEEEWNKYYPCYKGCTPMDVAEMFDYEDIMDFLR